jgi:DNA-directed RNA polymerase subunit RPC12/RpoP
MRYRLSLLNPLQRKSFFPFSHRAFQSKPLFIDNNEHLSGSGMLHCFECGYTHPTNAGLDEFDICPDCGNGILVKV